MISKEEMNKIQEVEEAKVISKLLTNITNRCRYYASHGHNNVSLTIDLNTSKETNKKIIAELRNIGYKVKVYYFLSTGFKSDFINISWK